MTEPIMISIEVEGSDDSASSIDGVSESLSTLQQRETSASEAAARLAQQQQAATVKAILFTAKLASASSAVQALTAALGSEGAAGLIGRVGASSAQFAELGGMLGPQGAIVGGIVGAVIPAISAVSDAIAEANERNAAWRQELAELEEAQRVAGRATSDMTDEIERQAEAVRDAADEMQQFVASLSRDGLQAQARGAAAQVAELADQLAGTNNEIRGLSGATGAAAALRLLDLRERAAQLTGEITRLNAEFQTVNSMAAENTTRQRDAGAAGEERWRREQEAWGRYNQAVQAGLDQEAASRERMIRLMIEEGRKAQERADEIIDAEMRIKAAAEGADAEAAAAAMDRMRQQQAADDALIEANRSAFDAHRQQVEGYQEVTDMIVGGLTDALTAIVTGEKSAEEAFSAMLTSFLKYIAEQAALKAVFEGAEAVAAFATQRYDQGAMHLLAAGAYAGVAVAAGVGSVAVSSAGSGARQSEPERGRSNSGGDGGGGTTVINWNSPVVTAGTRAQLGRELQQTIAAGQSRYA